MEPIASLVRKLEEQYGLSPNLVAAEADIDPTTLKRLLRNGGSHSNTVNRVRKAVAALYRRAEQERSAS